MNIMKSSLAFVAIGLSVNTAASTLDSARAIESQINQSAAQSQGRIDQSAEASLSMRAEIEALREEVKNLTVYRDHLARLVDSQEGEKSSLKEQIAGIQETRQGVVPLMYQMIDGLKTLIETDKPIKRDQRLARIAKLEFMMAQADISDAEKYRRILEAYQIEMDYGTKLGLYQGKVALSPSESIQADLLYLGRVAFVARSLDGQRYWAWNDSTSQWQALEANVGTDLDKAYAMASKQIAPGLISLPVSVNVEGQ
ncbi:DUF3450 domain-containing protein (plasmid) [Photobacterium sp. GJ3]|uniref:DUF3450 domain-containing protein n=1 Tax=Photobacterium sp. GJ3 TaxID=2829502 RepID=UPI001B8D31BB|nr:DUF3450 domain-containing protein [Photobacterium sp. GJ3]QUJ70312.1 DUF3450 domain-containing protein [Photobacterium sp. GJ3]